MYRTAAPTLVRHTGNLPVVMTHSRLFFWLMWVIICYDHARKGGATYDMTVEEHREQRVRMKFMRDIWGLVGAIDEYIPFPSPPRAHSTTRTNRRWCFTWTAWLFTSPPCQAVEEGALRPLSRPSNSNHSRSSNRDRS